MTQVQWKWQAVVLYGRMFCLALVLSLLALVFFPGTSQAHAILVQSDPSLNAVLRIPPPQVRLWFTEALNPALSTVFVLNADRSVTKEPDDPRNHVDNGDAHVSSSNQQEMDVSLKLLTPGTYVVVYRTQSAVDGHVAYGNFLFKVARADGSVPEFNGQIPSLAQFSNAATNGQLDGTGLFNLLMVTVVELGAIFWVGAQFWLTFLVPHSSDKDTPSDDDYTEDDLVGNDRDIQKVRQKKLIERELEPIHQQAVQRFVEHLALPALLLTFVANLGVLFGQALTVTGGRWDLALAPYILRGLITNGQFGEYWLARVLVLALAIALAMVTRYRYKKRSATISEAINWGNFLLALALLIVLALSGHAAAVRQNIVLYAVLIDWIHLLAAALWIGGMLYLALAYLPILKSTTLTLQTRVLGMLKVLARFSPMAIAGVILMAITGPLNATTRMESWQQLLDTAYGRTLIVKVVLVVALLIVSALHVFLWRPQLAEEYQIYSELQENNPDSKAEETHPDSSGQKILLTEDLKATERRLTFQLRRLTGVLSWEPLLGVSVLICTALLGLFSATLQPALNPGNQNQNQTTRPYTSTLKTTDDQYTLNVSITPNRFGTNQITVKVLDSQGQVVPTATIGVTAYTTMLDMDMGTTPVDLQADDNGNFTASFEYAMSGDWQIRLKVLANNTLHNATIKLVVPA